MTQQKQKIKYNRYLQRKKRSEHLTVCIVTIQNMGGLARAIFCADRLVTAGTQFELGQPKIRNLTPNCLIMIAGDALQGEIVIDNSKKRIIGLEDINNSSIDNVATILSEEYKNVLNANVDTQILNPLGLSVSSFPNKIKALPDWMGIELRRDIQEYSLDVEFLVFGVSKNSISKEETAHLYKVGDKGKKECYDNIGFASIGSGSSLAYSEMTKHIFNTNQNISEVMYRVFVAKKVAERVVGVGKYTDFGILGFFPNNENVEESRVFYFNKEKEIMEHFENTYKKQKETETELLEILTKEIGEKLFKRKT